MPDLQSSTQTSGRGIRATLTDLIGLRFEASRMPLPRNIRATHPISGQLRSKIQGRGVDFSEVRLYQPGDDVRSIDWRVTARTNQPHTKLFQEEKERPVLVLIDQGASLFFGSKVRFKSVAAARLGLSIAWSALAEGDRVGGIVSTEKAMKRFDPDEVARPFYTLPTERWATTTTSERTGGGPLLCSQTPYSLPIACHFMAAWSSSSAIFDH